MKFLKLTAFPLLISVTLLILSSCEHDEQLKKTTEYERKNIPMTGAQETPATVSTALGNLNVSYSKDTRVLNYNFTWAGLTGPVTLMHIHGLSPIGFMAPVIQTLIAGSNGIAVPNAVLYPATGKWTGSLFVDGVVVKEQELLNGMYYMNIHTAVYPQGEIRGQIIFQ